MTEEFNNENDQMKEWQEEKMFKKNPNSICTSWRVHNSNINKIYFYRNTPSHYCLNEDAEEKGKKSIK